jgi:hypothetical protein
MPVIAPPNGIFFYTFTQIAFLAHAFRGAARCAPDYFLFVAYFPHLVAGRSLTMRKRSRNSGAWRAILKVHS